MSEKRTVAKYGLAALGLAVIIIIGTTFAGIAPLAIFGHAQQGTLSVLLTDPPNVPSGVTAVYISYSDLQVHVADAGNESGWYDISSGGVIDLMQVLNVSQTIGSAQVPAGIYNMLRFNVTSATVTFEDTNYSAFVFHSEITTPVVGKLKVNSSQLSAAVIDISPTVIDIGSSSNHEFIISTVAMAIQMPSNETQQEIGIGNVGHVMNIYGKWWWNNFENQYSADIGITSASLSSSTLNVTVQNSGYGDIMLQEVVVSPYQASYAPGGGNHFGGHDNDQRYVPQMLGSAVFIINASGYLEPVNQQPIMNSNNGFGQQSYGYRNNGQSTNDMGAQFISMMGQSGYDLSAGYSQTFPYDGLIALLPVAMSSTQTGIVSGDQYIITVIGSGTTASIIVTAS
jgi:hypothetical protein